MRNLSGLFEVRRIALNIDPREGELALVPKTQLASAFGSKQTRIYSADELTISSELDDGISWSQVLLILLVALLLGEQALAYLVSYHPAPEAKRVRR